MPDTPARYYKQVVSAANPAVAGEALEIYGESLIWQREARQERELDVDDQTLRLKAGEAVGAVD